MNNFPPEGLFEESIVIAGKSEGRVFVEAIFLAGLTLAFVSNCVVVNPSLRSANGFISIRCETVLS